MIEDAAAPPRAPASSTSTSCETGSAAAGTTPTTRPAAPGAEPVTLAGHPGVRALRHRNYRLFFTGQLISLIGTWIQQVGEAWLVLQLTHDPLWLGIVSLAQFGPVDPVRPVRRRDRRSAARSGGR